MRAFTRSQSWPLTLAKWTHLVLILTAGSLLAQNSEPPEALYDAGDFYLLRDRSVVPLLRSAREIAAKRSKALPQQELVRAASAERVLTSFDAYGNPTTHQIEQYAVKDPAKARDSLAALEGVVWVSPVLATADTGKRVLLSDEIIVQFDEDMATDEAVERILEDLADRGIEVARPPLPSSPGQYLLRSLHADAEITLAEAAALFQQPGVAWAEPNFLAELETYSTIPNDPLFAWQQGLRNTGQNGATANADIRAADAWDIRTGNQRLVIAIIDTGVDTGHPDLQIFRNDAEWGNGRENNGVDNDGNGYIDDHQGWDFYSADNDPNPITSAGGGHGTACAGIAGAIGNNNLGIVGAAWSCRILPIRISTAGSDYAPVASISDSIRYAAQLADAVSCSWGYSTVSSAIATAIDYAAVSGRSGRGCPVFFAGGNEKSHWEITPRRVPCSIQNSGNYRLGITAFAATGINAWAQLGFDQIRLLATNGYTHWWHDDLETGASGWAVAHSGDVISDRGLTQLTGNYWSGSINSFQSPDFKFENAGAWAEVRTPTIWLPQGTHFLSFMTHRLGDGSSQLKGQVRLLTSDGVSLLTLDDAVWGYTSWLPGLAYPASYPNSIAVGACTDLALRAYYSRFTNAVGGAGGLFCVAPSHGGWNMVVTTDTRVTAGANDGTWSNGDYRLDFGGTSAATPLTAGVAALVLSKNANLPLAQLKSSLIGGCDKIGGVTYSGNPSWNPEYGYGRVNAYNSLNLAAADTAPPTVSSVVTRTGRAIEVTYSEQMGTGVTSPTLYTISGSGKGTLFVRPASVTSVSANTFLLEWTAGEMIAGTGNITITVGTAVRDIAGNGMGTPLSGSGNGSRVIHAHNCGPVGSSALYPIYPFDSERNYFSGVGGLRRSDAVDGIINNDGTPAAVYGSERSILGYTSYPGDIIYTLPNLNSALNHKVRLYFFNNGLFEFAGEVKFAVYINGVCKISSLDLWAESGGMRYGFWKEFTNIVPVNGNITIRVVPLPAFNHELGLYLYSATLSGIKVTAQ